MQRFCTKTLACKISKTRLVQSGREPGQYDWVCPVCGAKYDSGKPESEKTVAKDRQDFIDRWWKNLGGRAFP